MKHRDPSLSDIIALQCYTVMVAILPTLRGIYGHTMNLEQIIDDLVYRKKKLDLGSPKRQLIDRMRQHQQVSQKKPLKVVSRRARRNPL